MQSKRLEECLRKGAMGEGTHLCCGEEISPSPGAPATSPTTSRIRTAAAVAGHAHLLIAAIALSRSLHASTVCEEGERGGQTKKKRKWETERRVGLELLCSKAGPLIESLLKLFTRL